MEILTFISDAFSGRLRPAVVVDQSLAATELRSDAEAVGRHEWRELTCEMLDQYADAAHGFSPVAFCYYLPGIFSAGIRESRPDLLVNHSLIVGLDRGNAPASWDDFFRERWPRLNARECEAAQRWILWLGDFDPSAIARAALSRSFDTLEILKNQNSAIPIAGRSRA